jgi:hypothetical protein
MKAAMYRSQSPRAVLAVDSDRVQFLNHCSNHLVFTGDLPVAAQAFQMALWSQACTLPVSVVDQTEQFIRHQQQLQYHAAYRKHK